MMRRTHSGLFSSRFLELIPAALICACLLSSCKKAEPAPAAPQAVDWNRYYSTDETHQIMKSYAARYPRLARLYSIGKSYRGVDLLLMEVTNQDSGPAREKPGFYVDGNIHAGELAGSAVTLYLMGYLLDGYGNDPEVTALLDSRVFYLRPKSNPDGADLSLLRDAGLRSSVRPWDDDQDGLTDEDPAEDLNGDGFITQMRIPDPDGEMEISPEDPRLMVPCSEGSTGGTRYRLLDEGIDNDGDGRLSEDGIGGIDLNRNFPRGWELEYLQPGAGPFALSEPETYATVRFIDDHPNITGIVNNHTSGGFVYRLPSSSDPSTFNKHDLALVHALGAQYTILTGRPVMAGAEGPVPQRLGTLIEWAYEDRGIIGWAPEYWPGISADADADGETSEPERLRFNDEKLGGKYFLKWQPFDHPQFGRIEIGGWRSRFVVQNPPSELLEKECALQIPWIVYLARQSPMLGLSEPSVVALGEGRYRVDVTVENEGFLPTNLTERGLIARVVKPVYAAIMLEGGVVIEGSRRVSLGHLAGSYPAPDPARRSSAQVHWGVQVTAGTATAQILAVSEKGGTARSARFNVSR